MRAPKGSTAALPHPTAWLQSDFVFLKMQAKSLHFFFVTPKNSRIALPREEVELPSGTRYLLTSVFCSHLDSSDTSQNHVVCLGKGADGKWYLYDDSDGFRPVKPFEGVTGDGKLPAFFDTTQLVWGPRSRKTRPRSKSVETQQGWSPHRYTAERETFKNGKKRMQNWLRTYQTTFLNPRTSSVI